MYKFRLDDFVLPIAPSKMVVSVKNQNKTINLIDGTEINILKVAGLTTYDFDFLLPNSLYPFSYYEKGFETASYFLDKLEKLKISNKPFNFTMNREYGNANKFDSTSALVTLEDYKITEDAKIGSDISVSVTLKEFISYKTKIDVIKVENGEGTVAETVERQSEDAPKAGVNYTVVKGDSLWAIAKKHYNDGNQWGMIYEANKETVKNPNLIYPGQVLNIPKI